MPTKSSIKPIKAILFDLDGVLRNSNDVIFPAFEHAILTHTSTRPSRDEILPHIHHHRQVHKAFAPHIDEETFLADYWAKIEEFLPMVQQYEGANDMLHRLKSEGYKLGIVSSAKEAAEYLKRVEALDYFDVVVGGKDTEVHKPSPVPVHLAAEKLGINEREAVMIGDLAADIQAANSAGLRASIGITHGLGTKESLTDAGATYIIDSLDEIPEALARLQKI